jgi:GTPase
MKPTDLLAAFRATLEEISDSNLLIHLVDASNPRWEQQLQSVERILGELKFNQIPRLTVFNKADLLEPGAVESLLRQAAQKGAPEPVAVAAVEPKSLRPMLERASAILARDLVARPEDKEEVEYAAHS